MQGTVKEFSAETRSGSILLDDGSEVPLPADAFDRSGLLKLQFGQRVRFEVGGEGPTRRATSVDIVTL